MNDPFLNIHSYAHAQLVEQVMAMHGRGSSDPRQYRRTLECMSSAALQRALNESDFPVSTEALRLEVDEPRMPNGEASNGGSELSTRDSLTPQPTLP